MMAVANKSLVLLCFLLAIATSQAAEAACIDVCIKSFAVSPSATARDVVAGCTAKCALVENQRKTIDALLMPKTEDYNTTGAAVVEEEEKLTQEMISLNDELKKSNCPSTAARNCYNACRFAGGSRPTCAKLCGCTLTGTEAAVLEEVENLTEEMISLNNQLKKSNCPTTTARNCYNACRFAGGSRPTCAKLCGCTLTGTEATVVEVVEKLTEEMISLNDELKKSNCPSTAARNCYNACRFTGGSRPTCAKLCGCTLTGTEAAVVVEEEKLTEEMISLNDELKKSICPTTAARNCYNTCRFAGGSRPTCAKLCGCTLTGKRWLATNI